VSPRPQGLRVCCPKKPEWGCGPRPVDDGGAKVTVFFPGGGKRTLDTSVAELDLVQYDLATVMEVELARHLRERNCGVWQN